MRDVDALYTSGVPGLQPIVLAEYLGIHSKFVDSTSIGGSSVDSHVGHALHAMNVGACEVALITYGAIWNSGGVAVRDRDRSCGAGGTLDVRPDSPRASQPKVALTAVTGHPPGKCYSFSTSAAVRSITVPLKKSGFSRA